MHGVGEADASVSIGASASIFGSRIRELEDEVAAARIELSKQGELIEAIGSGKSIVPHPQQSQLSASASAAASAAADANEADALVAQFGKAQASIIRR